MAGELSVLGDETLHSDVSRYVRLMRWCTVAVFCTIQQTKEENTTDAHSQRECSWHRRSAPILVIKWVSQNNRNVCSRVVIAKESAIQNDATFSALPSSVRYGMATWTQRRRQISALYTLRHEAAFPSRQSNVLSNNAPER